MDWKTLKTFDFSKKIYRKPEVQKKYENEMNKYINYEKYILNKFLNNKLYNLQPNTYPYDLQPNIKHCVLWLNPIINKDNLKRFSNQGLIDFSNDNLKTTPLGRLKLNTIIESLII